MERAARNAVIATLCLSTAEAIQRPWIASSPFGVLAMTAYNLGVLCAFGALRG